MCHNQQQGMTYPPNPQQIDPSDYHHQHYYTSNGYHQYYEGGSAPHPPPVVPDGPKSEEEGDRTPPLPPEDDNMELDDSPIEDTSQSIDHTHSSPPSKSDTPTTSNIPTDQQQYQWPGQQYQEYPQQYRVGGYAPPVQHPYPPYTQPPYGQYYGGYYYPQQGYYPPNASPHPNAPPTQERWGQQQYPISPSQQRIVRSEPIATPTTSNPPPPVGHEPNWNQPQYPQWEGKRGGVSSPKGRGRGRGRRISSPAHQSKWGSNEGNAVPGGNTVMGKNSNDRVPMDDGDINKDVNIALDPSKWPSKLRDYLMRSFEACTCDGDRDHVEQYLKVEITAMFEDKRAWLIDWDTEPLPLTKLKRQGQKRKSRWDTPSPNADLRHNMHKRSSPPAPSRPGGMVSIQDRLGDGGRGRGRGRGKKKQWGPGKKGKFFIDRGGSPSAVISEDDKVKVNKRSQRFAKGSEGNQTFKPKLSIEQLMKTVCVSGEDDWKGFTIEGTSQEIEKRYLRLTSAPDPATVRPESILVKSMEFVLSRWKTKHDYRYTGEQLKAIRQDLMIQGIRDQFCVEVYETHARIALQNGDWGEFNQCQSQLRSLYREGISGHKAEFMSYRILYHMMTNESADLVQILTEITGDLLSAPAVDHALKLRKAWSFGNYYRFFQLYPSTPHCGRYLVDLFIERQKKNALKKLSKAYRPTLSVDYIANILGFSSSSECVNFLAGCDAVMNDSQTAIDCKLTHDKMSK